MVLRGWRTAADKVSMSAEWAITKVIRMDDGLGITIPEEIEASLGLVEGDDVDLIPLPDGEPGEDCRFRRIEIRLLGRVLPDQG